MNPFQVWVIVFIVLMTCWTFYQMATSLDVEMKRFVCAVVSAIIYGITLWIIYLGGFFGAVNG